MILQDILRMGGRSSRVAQLPAAQEGNPRAQLDTAGSPQGPTGICSPLPACPLKPTSALFCHWTHQARQHGKNNLDLNLNRIWDNWNCLSQLQQLFFTWTLGWPRRKHQDGISKPKARQAAPLECSSTKCFAARKPHCDQLPWTASASRQYFWRIVRQYPSHSLGS